jgi:hypothetical protein
VVESGRVRARKVEQMGACGEKWAFADPSGADLWRGGAKGVHQGSSYGQSMCETGVKLELR